MSAYYNEIDPYAAEWLRNLIKAGHIAGGDVDERSIVDVRADDLRGYTQCHFFAGIGGWSYALRLAGWGDDRPVWTGSCPCQPFSAAGKGEAFNDERHLWPAWFSLIAELRPAIVFGEQVEAAIGWGWLDAVFSDLEGQGYACGAAVLPACGVGAPHIRQRLWFVAHTLQPASEWRAGSVLGAEAASGRARQINGDRAHRLADGGQARSLANTNPRGRERTGLHLSERRQDQAVFDAPRSSEALELAHTDGRYASAEGLQRGGEHGLQPQGGGSGGVGHPDSEERTRAARGSERITRTTSDPRRPWDGAEWLPCTDGKARPVEPSTFPLAHGIPGRVGRLRAYGNAIVPQVAAEFIKAAA